jgi:hypothetical protein
MLSRAIPKEKGTISFQLEIFQKLIPSKVLSQSPARKPPKGE